MLHSAWSLPVPGPGGAKAKMARLLSCMAQRWCAQWAMSWGDLQGQDLWRPASKKKSWMKSFPLEGVSVPSAPGWARWQQVCQHEAEWLILAKRENILCAYFPLSWIPGKIPLTACISVASYQGWAFDSYYKFFRGDSRNDDALFMEEETETPRSKSPAQNFTASLT